MSKPDQDFATLLNDLDAGCVAARLAHALKEVALGVVYHADSGKTGKVTLEFTVARLGDGSQVNVQHKVAFSKPTKRGKVGEEDTTSTVMYVGKGGALTILPDTQTPLFKNEDA